MKAKLLYKTLYCSWTALILSPWPVGTGVAPLTSLHPAQQYWHIDEE